MSLAASHGLGQPEYAASSVSLFEPLEGFGEKDAHRGGDVVLREEIGGLYGLNVAEIPDGVGL